MTCLGGLNKRPENVCQKIMQALVNFAFEVKPKYVKSVSVVVFDKLIFGKYKNYMEQELKGKQSGMLPGKTGGRARARARAYIYIYLYLLDMISL